MIVVSVGQIRDERGEGHGVGMRNSIGPSRSIVERLAV